MNGNTNSKKKTSVKIFFNITTSLLVFTPVAKADIISSVPECAAYMSDPAAYSSCVKDTKAQSRADKAADDAKASCTTLEKQYSDARTERAKLCKSAGIGNDCESKIDACSDVSSSDSFNTLGALVTAVGGSSALSNAVGQASASGGNTCPQFSAQDFYQKKDKYNDDLDKAEEDLAKLTDDKADAQSDFNKEINDLQEDLNKAQEDLDKAKLEIADKKRKQMQDFQSTQATAKEDLRKKSSEILDLRGKLITAQRDKALQLIAMSDFQGQTACKKAVADARAAAAAGRLNSVGGGIQAANSMKNSLVNTYKACMDTFQQKRVSIIESSKQQQEQLQKSISDAQEDMNSTQDAINTAQSQLTEMQNDAATEQNNAEQKLIKLMQNTQNKMTAAKQKLETKLQTIAQKQEALTQKINRLNNQIAALGATPAAGSTTTASQSAEEFQAYDDQMTDAKNQGEILGCTFTGKRPKRVNTTSDGVG